MKKSALCLFLISLALLSYGQKKKPKVAPVTPKEYTFTVSKEVPYTSIKNQANSGTCWSFSGLAMLESELLRMGKDTVDLSEMWVVRNSYFEKVEKYIRLHGTANLSGGGSFYDVLHACQKYGVLPEEAYPGLAYGGEKHKHDELDRVIEDFGKSLTKTKNPSKAWRVALNGILDAYLGAAPKQFTYKGVEYTIESFTKSLGINFNDYVSITSFTHHPFYQPFIIEIPDNWAFSSSWNVPLNEFQDIINNAIETGYSVAWGTDVSEKSFSRDRASIPVKKENELIGTDQAKWTGEQAKDKAQQLEEEIAITQELRQEGFDDYSTTDDHGMQIVGKATDQDGRKYFKVKNSWGIGGKYQGILYASEAFVAYKTINIVVHKNAIPTQYRKHFSIY